MYTVEHNVPVGPTKKCVNQIMNQASSYVIQYVTRDVADA
jgi:hypothetical protein